jgi:hypothetical protein
MSKLPPPNHLETLRFDIISQIAEALENQTRTQRAATGISELNRNVHQEIADCLFAALATGHYATMTSAIEQVINTCSRLDQSLDLLVQQRSEQWTANSLHTQNLMFKINQTLDVLLESVDVALYKAKDIDKDSASENQH